MKYLIFTILLFPVLALAQETQTFSMGDMEFKYTESTEVDSVVYYYNGDAMLLSEHDLDGDDDADLWIMYKDDEVILEAHDTNDNNVSDTYFVIGGDNSVKEIYGENVENFERPEILSFEELTGSEASGQQVTTQEDLVGDLDSIKIPGGDSNTWIIFLILILGGGGYWWYSKKQKEN